MVYALNLIPMLYVFFLDTFLSINIIIKIAKNIKYINFFICENECSRFPEIVKVLQSPKTILLYPGDDAIDISELPPLEGDDFYTLVLLDGTWQQAKGMYTQNAMIKWPQKVSIITEA